MEEREARALAAQINDFSNYWQNAKAFQRTDPTGTWAVLTQHKNGIDQLYIWDNVAETFDDAEHSGQRCADDA